MLKQVWEFSRKIATLGYAHREEMITYYVSIYSIRNSILSLAYTEERGLAKTNAANILAFWLP